MNKHTIRLTFDVSEEAVMTHGIQQVLQGIRLREDGKVIVPIEAGRGAMINNPAPCGTWERVE